MIYNISNPIYKELKKLKLISERNLVKISSRTRDAKIGVLKDKKTKIIFLEKYITNNNYYTSLEYQKKDMNFLKKTKSTLSFLNDDVIRKKTYHKLLENKDILDFGCEWAGFLKNIKNAKSLYGIEIRNECIKFIKENFSNINISNDINNYKKKFDIITLFHVLEHLPDQLNVLKKFFKKLKNRGKLILEVPHAGDLLINKLNLKHYKNFIFWSEHLILHSEKSLTKYLKKAGFKKIKFYYYQRHNFLNHINWILNDDYGGHIKYKRYHSNIVNSFYNNFLIKKKLTDTIKVVAEK